jgi:hypothetical protein
VNEIATTVPIVDHDKEVAEEHALLLVEVRRVGRPRGATT